MRSCKFFILWTEGGLFDFFILLQKPETWELLKKKYDPTGQYSVKFEDQAKKKGINLWII